MFLFFSMSCINKYCIYIIVSLTIILTGITSNVNAQVLLEGGPYVGVSWYNGDLNPQRYFYNMHPSFGGLIRFSVNDRIGFRGSFIYGGISGSYPAKDVLIHQTINEPYDFERNIGDIAVMFEMNLFPFDHPYKKNAVFTPYVAVGLGTIFYERFTVNSEKSQFVLSLPFGAGVKWKIRDGIRFGAEWTMRKSFTDDLDVVGYGNSVDPANPYGFNTFTNSHNNDWVSFVGVYVSFTLLNRRYRCDTGGF